MLVIKAFSSHLRLDPSLVARLYPRACALRRRRVRVSARPSENPQADYPMGLLFRRTWIPRIPRMGCRAPDDLLLATMNLTLLPTEASLFELEKYTSFLQKRFISGMKGAIIRRPL